MNSLSPILSLPQDPSFQIFNNLAIKDLFSCEQTCKELDKTITFLFSHNREDISKIFKPGKPIFFIICDEHCLKTELVGNKFFSQLCCKEFIQEWNCKLVKDIFPFFAEQKNFFESNGQKPEFIPKYQRSELEIKRSENEEGYHPTTFHIGHPIFEKEMFVLLENHGLSTLLCKAMMEKYLAGFENENEDAFFNACNTGAFFGELHGFGDKAIISFMEIMVDILFESFVKKSIAAIKNKLEKDPSQVEEFKVLLQNTESKNLGLMFREINPLQYLDGALQAIKKGKYPSLPSGGPGWNEICKKGLCGHQVSEKYKPLKERLKDELFPAVQKLLNQF